MQLDPILLVLVLVLVLEFVPGNTEEENEEEEEEEEEEEQKSVSGVRTQPNSLVEWTHENQPSNRPCPTHGLLVCRARARPNQPHHPRPRRRLDLVQRSAGDL